MLNKKPSYIWSRASFRDHWLVQLPHSIQNCLQLLLTISPTALSSASGWAWDGGIFPSGFWFSSRSSACWLPVHYQYLYCLVTQILFPVKTLPAKQRPSGSVALTNLAGMSVWISGRECFCPVLNQHSQTSKSCSVQTVIPATTSFCSSRQIKHSRTSLLLPSRELIVGSKLCLQYS